MEGLFLFFSFLSFPSVLAIGHLIGDSSAQAIVATAPCAYPRRDWSQLSVLVQTDFMLVRTVGLLEVCFSLVLFVCSYSPQWWTLYAIFTVRQSHKVLCKHGYGSTIRNFMLTLKDKIMGYCYPHG